ncbi:MAG: hypothetical protein MPJ50_04370 [Pirellulales bacterium]|nr:hypothetical protein [Pirellulales bacterium]
MRHIQRRGGKGYDTWRNRCLDCGYETEYLPSLERIAYEKARIRAENGCQAVDDALERFWRAANADQLSHALIEDECPFDDRFELWQAADVP